jgi:hypothetical protein
MIPDGDSISEKESGIWWLFLSSPSGDEGEGRGGDRVGGWGG